MYGSSKKLPYHFCSEHLPRSGNTRKVIAIPSKEPGTRTQLGTLMDDGTTFLLDRASFCGTGGFLNTMDGGLSPLIESDFDSGKARYKGSFSENCLSGSNIAVVASLTPGSRPRLSIDPVIME